MVSFLSQSSWISISKHINSSINSGKVIVAALPSAKLHAQTDLSKSMIYLLSHPRMNANNNGSNALLSKNSMAFTRSMHTSRANDAMSLPSAHSHVSISMSKATSQHSTKKIQIHSSQQQQKSSTTNVLALTSVALLASSLINNYSKSAMCEGAAAPAVAIAPGNDHDTFAESSQEIFKHGKDQLIFKNRIRKISWFEWLSNFIGHAFRAVELLIIFSPALITSPFIFIIPSDYLAHLWRKLLVISLEIGGPTWIKLAQWASTRADLFSREFRDDISVLHDQVGSESKYLTKQTLNEAFGVPFSDVFEFVDFDHPIGAGCIAQVYKGKLLKDGRKVAIKVRRRGVAKKIERDLDLMVFGSKLIETVIPSFKWFNLNNAALMFAEFMESQLDMRREGRSLEVFRENFADNPRIRFPEPIAATETVLVETFCEGTRLNVFLDLIANEEKNQKKVAASAENDDDDDFDDIDDEENIGNGMSRKGSGSVRSILESLTQLRKDVAVVGIHAFLQMVLVDNWVHSDLHSGNILIKTNPPLETIIKSIEDQSKGNGGSKDANASSADDEGEVNRSENFKDNTKEKRMSRKQQFNNVKFEEFVILDTGLLTTLTDKDLINFLDLFKAVADGDGELAGRLMIDRSKPPKDPKTGWPEGCVDPEGFITGMKDIVSKVKLESFRLDKIQIGRVLEQVLMLVHNHRVLIDTSFTSLVVAIVVLEGVGRQLDPTLNLFKESLPILAKADEK